VPERRSAHPAPGFPGRPARREPGSGHPGRSGFPGCRRPPPAAPHGRPAERGAPPRPEQPERPAPARGRAAGPKVEGVPARAGAIPPPVSAHRG